MNIVDAIDSMPKLQEHIMQLEQMGFKRKSCDVPGKAVWRNGDVLVQSYSVGDWEATTVTAGILVDGNSPKDAVHHLIQNLHEYSVAKRLKFNEEISAIESCINQIGLLLGLPCGKCEDDATAKAEKTDQWFLLDGDKAIIEDFKARRRIYKGFSGHAVEVAQGIGDSEEEANRNAQTICDAVNGTNASGKKSLE